MITQWISAVFSPTGTTLKVARAVAEGGGCSVRAVDLSTPVEGEAVPADVALLAAVPVYGGRVPAVALERLSGLRGMGGPAIAVVVYGNRHYDDALLEWKNALEKNGFRVASAGAFVAEHSIVRTIAAGRPDTCDLRAARDFGAATAKKLSLPKEEQTPVQVPGNPVYKVYNGMPARPEAGKNCTKCGTCARLCPVGAIPPEAPNLTHREKCITCMRCVSVCPAKARALPASMLIATTAMLKTKAATRREPEVFL